MPAVPPRELLARPAAATSLCGIASLLWPLALEQLIAKAKYSHPLSPQLIRTEISTLQALTFSASFFTQAPSLSRELLKSWENPTLLHQTISMTVMSLSHFWSALPVKAAAAGATEAAQGWIYVFIYLYIMEIDSTFPFFRFTHPLVGVFPSL